MAAIANIFSLKKPKYWENTITSMFDGLNVLFLGKQFMHCGLRSSQSWPHIILGMTAKLWCSVVYHMPLTSTTGTQFIKFGNKRSQTDNLAQSSLNICPVQANSQWRDPTKPYITVFTSASDHWNLSAPSKLIASANSVVIQHHSNFPAFYSPQVVMCLLMTRSEKVMWLSNQDGIFSCLAANKLISLGNYKLNKL